MIKKIIILFFVVFQIQVAAQELDCTVLVNYEQLDNASKDRVAEFGQLVQNYMNTTKFSETEWNWDKIKCSLNIFFTGASEEINYSAQVVISSQRKIEGTDKNTLMLTIMDNMWKFTYEKNQSLFFDRTTFHPLTSFLDFYAFIILGYDSDSYEILGGSEFFQKAYDISILGGTTKYSEGYQSASTAYNKRGLVENLTNGRFQMFRQDFYSYHYNGLDMAAKNPQKAISPMVLLVKNLYDIRDKVDRRSPILKVFFDAKYNELIEYLKKSPDKSVFELLKSIDPSHISKYLEATDNK
ncbi:MAG: DUF4835 family protein [bacterium]